ncbi:MAG: extracellular solute-binding protein [Clostridiaceae bacterium]|nr:extracellular solute-binding protein [Clostridiaceae bacterium]
MIRVFRRIMLILLIISLIALTACVPSVYSSKASEETGEKQAAPQNQQITLKLWHIWATDSDSNKMPFEKALKNWNDSHPEIHIVTDATESETYKIKIRTAIAVNEAPDIFFCWGAGFAKPFVEAGKVLALDEYIDENVKSKLVPGSLENFTYGGKIYALPTFMIAGIFYCNEELFNNYDIKIPDTFDELLDAVAAFRKHKITPMAVGLKDGWPGIFYQNILAVRTAGIEKCAAALNKEISFFQPEFIESAEKLVQLIDAGAFDSKCTQLTQHEAESQFLNGKIPMYYGGSWAAGSMERDDCAVKGKVIVRNFPVLEGASGDQKGFLGGAIDNFMISASTQYKKEAVDAMVSILENFCKESYLSGAGLPAWKFDVSGAKISPLANEISKLIEDRDGFLLAWDTFLSGSDSQTHIDLVTDLFLKRIDPEDFAINMQKLNISK